MRSQDRAARPQALREVKIGSMGILFHFVESRFSVETRESPSIESTWIGKNLRWLRRLLEGDRFYGRQSTTSRALEKNCFAAWVFGVDCFCT